MNENTKLRHPFYRLMELTDENLKIELASWTRNDLIAWLQWNDPNGIYNDKDSKREFNNVMSRKQGIEIMTRQIAEGREEQGDAIKVI